MKIEIGNLVTYLNDKCTVEDINEDGSLHLIGNFDYPSVNKEDVALIPFVEKFEIGDRIVNSEGIEGTVKGIAHYIIYVEFDNGDAAYYACQGQVNERIVEIVNDGSDSLFLRK